MAVSLFTASEYRGAVQTAIDRVRFHKPLTYARLARQSGIQATYFSNVLKGRAHFNADQLYRIAKCLELSETELEFVLTLMEWERSAFKERKRELARRIETIRQDNLSTSRYVSARTVAPEDSVGAEYYLDPLCKVVHVYLGIDRYAREPKLIAEALHISNEYLGRLLETLVRLGYVQSRGATGYTLLLKHRHLPDESPLCLPHQALMRARSLEQFQRLPRGKRYGFSATISATPETRARIQGEFLDFVKRAEALVAGSKETHVFQMNFDLFPWAD
jgi:transcriptional regulator with XRE-family HTH domain